MFDVHTRFMSIALATVIVFLAGCVETQAPGPPPLPEDPGAALRAIEARLVEADDLRVEVDITASGIIAADLAGHVALGQGAVDLDQRGTFVGKPAELFLEVEGGRLVGGNGAHRFETDVPPALHEAMVLGLVRMGLLHNLARLSGAVPPDHAEGGVDAWLTVVDPAWVETEPSVDSAERAIEFDLRVAGQDAATVRLWVDPETGLPTRREQTVRFPQGTMDVVERYSGWTVEAASRPES